jgi:hypothetical protein
LIIKGILKEGKVGQEVETIEAESEVKARAAAQVVIAVQVAVVLVPTLWEGVVVEIGEVEIGREEDKEAEAEAEADDMMAKRLKENPGITIIVLSPADIGIIEMTAIVAFPIGLLIVVLRKKLRGKIMIIIIKAITAEKAIIFLDQDITIEATVKPNNKVFQICMIVFI